MVKLTTIVICNAKLVSIIVLKNIVFFYMYKKHTIENITSKFIKHKNIHT